MRDYMGRLERSHRASPGREEPTTSGDEIKPMNLIVVTGGGELPRRHRRQDMV